MKDVFLKIINKDIKLDKDAPIMLCSIIGKEQAASEIADIVKAFDEWKDKCIQANEIWFNPHNITYELFEWDYEHTHDGLFEFWYNEIREQN